MRTTNYLDSVEQIDLFKKWCHDNIELLALIYNSAVPFGYTDSKLTFFEEMYKNPELLTEFYTIHGTIRGYAVMVKSAIRNRSTKV